MQIQIREAFKRSLKLRGDRIYLYLFALCCVSFQRRPCQHKLTSTN